MTSSLKKIFFIFLIEALMGSVYGYGVNGTHQYMSERSAELISGGNNAYAEIDHYKSQIVAGSVIEDGLVGERGILHFYHPPTKGGLGLYGLGAASALETGQIAWESAINFYTQSQGTLGLIAKTEAYRKLGSALHLFLQDLSSPPHVHLDVHAPHAWGFGGDDAPLENRGDILSARNNLPQGSVIQGANLSNPKDFGMIISNLTYQGNGTGSQVVRFS